MRTRWTDEEAEEHAVRRFLIDTDTASDDAVALIMALRAPEVNVEALTITAGNVPLDRCVQNALYTVELCGSSVPVHAGLAQPMFRELTTAEMVHGNDGLGDIGLDLGGRSAAEGHAVDVLVETICAAPGEIDLVTLGPLSNVGTALLRAPELAGAVKHCYVMGGTGRLPGNITPAAEFNIYVDPEAARIVFESGMPITMVGWDVSWSCAFVGPEGEARLRAIGTPYSEFTCDIQRALVEFVGRMTGAVGFDLPDPLAMAVALDPTIAETQDFYVEVVPGDGPARGQTIVDHNAISGKPANAAVVTHVPPEAFMSLLCETLR
ncbi:MAG: nucleoside hydrolase [Acidimicrobiia bacterium]|nr:nucleoside hydrolase [Acidimicrobiia bacterium]MYJ12929.1 nucleoside hydrolase [Acidimicrobiia bacterium]